MRHLVLPAALAVALVATAAHADGFSISTLFQTASSADGAPIRQAAHNRYAPYDGVETVPAGQVYASGHYASKARALGLHNRYVD